MRRRRRAVILPVVLVLISLLAITMAGFLFFVRSETAGTIAMADGHQARLSAESALEEIIAIIRIEKHNAAAWFDAPERLRNALVYSDAYDRQSDPLGETRSRRELFEEGGVVQPAWRYSLVGRRFDSIEDSIRYGITPEASKLHLNVATEQQLTQLFTPLLIDLNIENPQELVSALLDWRDEDSDLREDGAENDYYNLLEPPYNVKNGPFNTVEELLLVKGFTAAVLYGEDVNRNGILDPNEDDGEETFPYYDNADGNLNPGLAPFLTIWTREVDAALDNKPRINLNADGGTIATQLAEQSEDGELSDEAMAFIISLKQQNFNFSQIGSPADLYTAADDAEGDDPEAGGTPVNAALADSPVTLEDLPFLMDRCSTRDPAQASQPIVDLINVNTAPARVLMLVPGVNDEVAAAIVTARSGLDAESLRTTAWLVSTGAVSPAVFRQIAPRLTTKAHQFHIEALGYGDHTKLFRRVEWIVEMVGPAAQIMYRRDLTSLGMAWPIDEDLPGELGGG